MLIVRILVGILTGYLLGGIPTGVLAAKPLGKDPRQIGSGRTGGTNVYRAAGMPAALLTVAGDIVKGFVAVKFAEALVSGELGLVAGATSTDPWVIGAAASLAGLAAILGHNYSPYLGFTGGAGSTPNLGALFAINPWLAVLGLAAGIVLMFTVRVASIASLTVSAGVAVSLAALVLVGTHPASILIYGLGQLLLVVWALRPNIRRLRAGTESRVDFGRGSNRADDADGSGPIRSDGAGDEGGAPPP